MDAWKIQLVLMAFCALMQTYQAALSSKVSEERRLSSAWQDESVDAGLTHQLLGLMKRSKALHFYGLMGKRSGVKKPFQVQRRNKGAAFVGLMGRSISSEESLKRVIPASTTIDVLEKPHDRGVFEGMGPNPELMD